MHQLEVHEQINPQTSSTLENVVEAVETYARNHHLEMKIALGQPSKQRLGDVWTMSSFWWYKVVKQEKVKMTPNQDVKEGNYNQNEAAQDMSRTTMKLILVVDDLEQLAKVCFVCKFSGRVSYPELLSP